jgi:dTDP-4-amino-4,6-dideoxygalactose transaminase
VSRLRPSPATVEVPFNQPYTSGAELEYIREAIAGSHLSGNGPFTQKCSAWLEAALGARRVLLTHSCTGALEMATLLAEIGAGDEVIMPSFAFTSTATAVALRGGTPVFVDIEDDTLNIDAQRVANAVTDRTRAIMPVHYAGVACAMDELTEIAAARGLFVIEDAAHALGSTLKGRPLGAIGTFGTLSFHETKNVISGEGGALIVNDPDFVDRAEILLEKGTNRRAFFRGEVDKYTWLDLGSSFLASELTCAFLWAQIERAEWLNAQRMNVWRRYHDGFADLAREGLVRRPVVPMGAEHNAHLYFLLTPDESVRNDLIDSLAREHVRAVFHYLPLHSSPAGRRLGRVKGELPVTDRASATLVRLPLWVGMSDAQVEHVISAVHRALA